MKKLDLEKLKEDHLSLGYEILNNLKTYPIEKCIDLALSRFDAHIIELEIYEKMEKKYYGEIIKDEMSKKVLGFHMNKCRNYICFFKNCLTTIFNDIPDSFPDKAKLGRKIKTRNVSEQLYDPPNLPVEFTLEELQEMPVQDKIRYLISDYKLSNLVTFELRKILNKLYAKEKFKHYEKAFLGRVPKLLNMNSKR
jgi:hypothetical protein